MIKSAVHFSGIVFALVFLSDSAFAQSNCRFEPPSGYSSVYVCDPSPASGPFVRCEGQTGCAKFLNEFGLRPIDRYIPGTRTGGIETDPSCQVITAGVYSDSVIAVVCGLPGSSFGGGSTTQNPSLNTPEEACRQGLSGYQKEGQDGNYRFYAAMETGYCYFKGDNRHFLDADTNIYDARIVALGAKQVNFGALTKHFGSAGAEKTYRVKLDVATMQSIGNFQSSFAVLAQKRAYDAYLSLRNPK